MGWLWIHHRWSRSKENDSCSIVLLWESFLLLLWGFQGISVADNNLGQLRLLMILQLTSMLRWSILSPILSLYIKSHGLSVSQIGYLGIAGMLGWLIFEPLFGFVADNIRKKYLVIFAILGSSIIYAMYPRASLFSQAFHATCLPHIPLYLSPPWSCYGAYVCLGYQG